MRCSIVFAWEKRSTTWSPSQNVWIQDLCTVWSETRQRRGRDGGHALLQTVIQHRAWSSFYHKPAACTNYCLYPAQNQGRGPAEIAIEMHRTWVWQHKVNGLLARSVNQVSFLRLRQTSYDSVPAGDMSASKSPIFGPPRNASMQSGFALALVWGSLVLIYTGTSQS
jgi:hypothetical protein